LLDLVDTALRHRSVTDNPDIGQVLAGPSHAAQCSTSVLVVENRNDIRDFLASRRARITPEEAGLPSYGSNRRVPGLRREEVALLAGVSVDYYTRLERGNLNGVSDGVLDALAGALQLDEAERAHLFDLARAANPTVRTRRRPVQEQVRPSVIWLVNSPPSAKSSVLAGPPTMCAFTAPDSRTSTTRSSGIFI
jgi:transcriptional regulator with XRE-family HTH domain